MDSFRWSHPKSTKRSQETGQLRGVGNVAWRSVFTGSGRKSGWGIVLTIWFSCYAKNGMGKQTVVGGWILLVGKIIEFLATVGDRNPPVGKILKYTSKNHYLLFIIKHSKSILGIIKNIWLYLKIYYCAQISGKILLWTFFRKSVTDVLASCNNMTYVSGAELLSVFFIYKSNYRKTYKKGALYLTFYCYDVKSRRLTLNG